MIIPKDTSATPTIAHDTTARISYVLSLLNWCSLVNIAVAWLDIEFSNDSHKNTTVFTNYYTTEKYMSIATIDH